MGKRIREMKQLLEGQEVAIGEMQERAAWLKEKGKNIVEKRMWQIEIDQMFKNETALATDDFMKELQQELKTQKLKKIESLQFKPSGGHPPLLP